MALLDIRNLRASYGPTPVTHDCNICVEEGRVTAILGANGAGKTTILRAICGMVRVKGEIQFDGKNIAGRSTDEIVRLGVAHVPDGRGTFTQFSVEDNLRLGAYLRNRSAQRDSDFSRVYSYFPRLAERRKQQAGTLSGGEQQMLAIGRALMLRPRLLLMDEPSFGLAPLVVDEIFDIMAKINSQERVTILLVEQNASLALELAEQAYVLETGRIALSGPSRTLRDDENVRRLYLGY